MDTLNKMVIPNEYSSMIVKSLVSTGNNNRIKKAIEKAMNGEEVTIAYIGGSITEGANASVNEKCYAYLSYLYFKETFSSGDGSHVKFVNAGMGGTPSTLGMIRYKRDVLDKALTSPDIVFVEFAVNDADDPTNGDSYESLVLKILLAQNNPAVILLFSIFKSKWNLQDRLQPIGTYYDLPMISIKDAILSELEAGTLTNEEYFSDLYHPTDYGHQIMSDCVTHYFDTVNMETIKTNDITIPSSAKIGRSFVDIKMVDSLSIINGITIERGSFSESDPELSILSTTPNTTIFPNNWMYQPGTGNESFSMSLTCKNLLLVYKKSSSDLFGSAEIYINGNLIKTINSNQVDGWNNSYTLVLLDENIASFHKVKVKMADGNEEKCFSILAFGYTE